MKPFLPMRMIHISSLVVCASIQSGHNKMTPRLKNKIGQGNYRNLSREMRNSVRWHFVHSESCCHSIGMTERLWTLQEKRSFSTFCLNTVFPVYVAWWTFEKFGPKFSPRILLECGMAWWAVPYFTSRVITKPSQKAWSIPMEWKPECGFCWF